MLRITRTAMNGIDRLRLEGKLVGPWVAEVRAACCRASQATVPIEIDLTGVSFVDAEGLQLLRQLERDGHDVTACSRFVAELLRTETSR